MYEGTQQNQISSKAIKLVWGIIATILLLEVLEYRSYMNTIGSLLSFSTIEWTPTLIFNTVYLIWLPIALVLFARNHTAGWYLLSIYFVAVIAQGLSILYILNSNFTDIINTSVNAAILFPIVLHLLMLVLLHLPTVRSLYHVTLRRALITMISVILIAARIMIRFLPRLVD